MALSKCSEFFTIQTRDDGVIYFYWRASESLLGLLRSYTGCLTTEYAGWQDVLLLLPVPQS